QILRPRRGPKARTAPATMAQLLTGASVKTNAPGINRFAMKRPFAAVMIYIYGALHKSGHVSDFGMAGRLYLTVSQLHLPNLLDRVVGVTTELGWCPSPALNGGKSCLSAPCTVPEQQTK